MDNDKCKETILILFYIQIRLLTRYRYERMSPIPVYASQWTTLNY